MGKFLNDRGLGAVGALVGVVILSGLAGGCSTSGCLENQNSLPLAGFYSSSTGNSISLDSLEIGGVGAPNDSLLLASGSASTLYMPFRSQSPRTSFYFRYTQKVFVEYGVTDTVTFSYDALPYFASEECGAMYQYRITGVTTTTNLIDSVGITDSLITNLDIERIKIYFRTAE